MIDIAEVAKVIDAYLDRNSGERQRLAPLLASLTQRTAITDRSTFTGHITCSALLVNPERHVLHVRHNALSTWLRPGGHLEPSDTTILDAALRELEEEAGIPRSMPRPLAGTMPLDIDVHQIPANPARNEPGHPHFDLQYAFAVSHSPSLTLQTQEVNAFDWLPIDQIVPDVLRAKLLLVQ